MKIFFFKKQINKWIIILKREKGITSPMKDYSATVKTLLTKFLKKLICSQRRWDSKIVVKETLWATQQSNYKEKKMASSQTQLAWFKFEFEYKIINSKFDPADYSKSYLFPSDWFWKRVRVISPSAVICIFHDQIIDLSSVTRSERNWQGNSFISIY